MLDGTLMEQKLLVRQSSTNTTVTLSLEDGIHIFSCSLGSVQYQPSVYISAFRSLFILLIEVNDASYKPSYSPERVDCIKTRGPQNSSDAIAGRDEPSCAFHAKEVLIFLTLEVEMPPRLYGGRTCAKTRRISG